jgi:RNA polymerase sigma-54 factor
MQNFDPPGVLARSLKECLALQLKERGRFDPMIAKFLEHLELLAAHDLRQLKRILGTDMEDITDMIAEIRTLNPKPGNAFGGPPVQTVIADVLVRPASDGSWHIELNSETLPRVLVNRAYYTRVSGGMASQSRDTEFLVECLNTANWLLKSLDQRARTILRVAEEIVRQQDAFLVHGVQHLRPLNLKTVADAIKMHESTVSRVTSSKYMATNRGISRSSRASRTPSPPSTGAARSTAPTAIRGSRPPTTRATRCGRRARSTTSRSPATRAAACGARPALATRPATTATNGSASKARRSIRRTSSACRCAPPVRRTPRTAAASARTRTGCARWPRR